MLYPFELRALNNFTATAWPDVTKLPHCSYYIFSSRIMISAEDRTRLVPADFPGDIPRQHAFVDQVLIVDLRGLFTVKP